MPSNRGRNIWTRGIHALIYERSRHRACDGVTAPPQAAAEETAHQQPGSSDRRHQAGGRWGANIAGRTAAGARHASRSATEAWSARERYRRVRCPGRSIRRGDSSAAGRRPAEDAAVPRRWGRARRRAWPATARRPEAAWGRPSRGIEGRTGWAGTGRSGGLTAEEPGD